MLTRSHRAASTSGIRPGIRLGFGLGIGLLAAAATLAWAPSASAQQPAEPNLPAVNPTGNAPSAGPGPAPGATQAPPANREPLMPAPQPSTAGGAGSAGSMGAGSGTGGTAQVITDPAAD